MAAEHEQWIIDLFEPLGTKQKKQLWELLGELKTHVNQRRTAEAQMPIAIDATVQPELPAATFPVAPGWRRRRHDAESTGAQESADFRVLCGAARPVPRAQRKSMQCAAIVITGAGGNFCSGGDVHEIIGPLTGATPGIARVHPHDGRSRQGDARIVRNPSSRPWTGCAPARAPSSPWRRTSGWARRGRRPRFSSRGSGLAGCDMGACAILPRIIGHGRASELSVHRAFHVRGGRARVGLLQPPDRLRMKC